MDNPVPFDGGRLRELRTRGGYSQEDLANLAKVSPKTVRDAESKKRVPRGYIQRALAKALECSLEDLQSPPTVAPLQSEGLARDQLPVPPRRFVGRERDLERLTAAMREGGRVVIEGASGVGKTTLASVFAWSPSLHYPDGTIFVDLQGGSDPMPAERAMRHVLWSLHSGPVVVDSHFDLHGAYHRLLREKRVLLVLDNAADAAQIAPLIPPLPSAVIVTARQSLASLDCDALVLQPLARAASIELLRSSGCGSDHAERLAAVCGGLPLVLRVVAREAAQADCDVDELVRELESEHSRLPVLDAIAPAQQISASLQRGIDMLEPELRKGLAVLQVFPQELDRAAAGQVWNIEPRRALRMLRELSTRRLVQHCTGRGGKARYRVHDLVRIAAAKHASKPELDEAKFRHAQHYLKLLRPFDPVAPNAADDIAEVSARIRAHAADLYAALHWCTQRPPHCPQAAMLLPRVHRAWVLNVLLGQNAYRDGARSVIDDASESSERVWMPHLWLKLGDVCLMEGDFQTAISAFERAVREVPALGNPHLVQLAGSMLGLALVQAGEMDQAFAVIRPYVRLARQRGDATWESFSLMVLGFVFLGWRDRKSEALFTASLTASLRGTASMIRLQAKRGLAYCLSQRGEVKRAYALGSEALDEVRQMAPTIGSAFRESAVLITLATICLGSDLDAAARYADEALRMTEHGTSRPERVRALYVRAAVALASPSWKDAEPFVDAALDVDRSLQPYAHRYAARQLAAQFMTRAQRHDEAVALLESLIAREPAGRIRARQDCENRLSLAAFLVKLGRDDAARDHTAATLACISRFRLHADDSLFGRARTLHARLAVEGRHVARPRGPGAAPRGDLTGGLYVAPWWPVGRQGPGSRDGRDVPAAGLAP